MKLASLVIKKTIKCNVIATTKEVKIRFPKQSLGIVAINLLGSDNQPKQLKQFQLWLVDGGEKIKAEAL